MADLELIGLSKRFPGGVEALREVDLRVEDGRRLAILGPSGSGKSTLLRLIAGLDDPTTGTVRLGGRDVTGLAPWLRGVGMVFQQPALMPHLNVRDNLAFGLRPARLSREEVARRVAETAEPLGLSELMSRKPAQLSGGQRQRVAIGRALARRPSVLLLDEPFAGLDTPLRLAIRRDLESLQRRQGLTTVLVTHDQAEALAFGDLAAVLVAGRRLQLDPPRALYDRPASRAVAAFLGTPPMDFLPARILWHEKELRLVVEGSPPVALELADWSRPLHRRGPGPITLGVRAEAVGVGGAGLRVHGRVAGVATTGPEEIVEVALGSGPAGGVAHLRRAPGDGPAPGAAITLAIDPSRLVWFDPETGERIAPADPPR